MRPVETNQEKEMERTKLIPPHLKHVIAAQTSHHSQATLLSPPAPFSQSSSPSRHTISLRIPPHPIPFRRKPTPQSSPMKDLLKTSHLLSSPLLASSLLSSPLLLSSLLLSSLLPSPLLLSSLLLSPLLFSSLLLSPLLPSPLLCSSAIGTEPATAEAIVAPLPTE